MANKVTNNNFRLLYLHMQRTFITLLDKLVETTLSTHYVTHITAWQACPSMSLLNSPWEVFNLASQPHGLWRGEELRNIIENSPV